MKKVLKLVCFTLLMSMVSVYGQATVLKGIVKDNESKEVIPYATVVLKKENTIFKGVVTNEKGEFQINKIPKGNYNVEISFIGYVTSIKELLLKDSEKEKVLKDVFLFEDSVALETVEITAEKSTIIQKIDRKIIEIGKDLTSVGASASDIMSNIPSVSVNQDGEISLRGNENVRVLVDGKLTNNTAAELLQQIPSTSIKSIELITNPSAKYNPDGMSGIINIILKKNVNLGFNSSITSGVTFGQRTRFNNAFNFNYKTGKVNFFGNYGNRLGVQVTDGLITRTEEEVSQLTKNFNERNSHLVKAGVDYFVNEKNTISMYANYNKLEGGTDGSRDITYYNNPFNNFTQYGFLKSSSETVAYNLDFKHDLKKQGHYLELELNYNTLNRGNTNDFLYVGQSPIDDYLEQVSDERDNTILNIDYTNPLKENVFLEMGIETRIRNTNNIYKTNHMNFSDAVFKYDRDIFSFYTTFSQSFQKWKYNIGVRVEDYNVEAVFDEAVVDSVNFSDNLINVFPSGFISFTPDEDKKQTIQLNVGRRIDRPSLNQINPTRQISTPLTIIKGNPLLRPQFTNSIEVNYLRKINKGSINGGVFYRRAYDEINRIGYFDVDNPSIFVIDYENFDSNDMYGLEFSSRYRVLKWWSFNASFDVYSRNLKGVIESEDVSVSNSLLNFKMSHSFKLLDNVVFQLFSAYSGPQKVLQYELKDNFYLNTGLRYNFAKGRGSVNVNFNDVFKTRRFAFEAFRTILQEGEFKRDTHTVFFGFNYRFGGGKNKALQRKKREKNIKADKFL